MHDPNRTSDDSGLTSDETSGERRFPPTSLSIYSHHNNQQQSPGTSSSGGESSSNTSSGAEILTSATMTKTSDLMTQSTSAILMKRSPRQPRRPNGFPKTTLKDYRNQPDNQWLPPVSSASNERENESPSTTDSSPWDEKPKAPIPTPRKKQSDGCPVILRKMERDSLNSYAEEEDYGEYDEDEIFDEIADDSPSAAACRQRADYVNLSDFCVVKDSAHVYSDIVKVAPEIPKHQPLIQFEQKLCRTAEKCLSIIEDDPSTSGAEQSFQFLSTKFLRTSDNSRRHPTSSAGSLPSRESNPDSGLGRCSSERVASNGSRLPEKLPDCMVLTHPPRETTESSCSRNSATSDYALPPHDLGTMRTQRNLDAIGLSPLALRASIVPQNDAEMSGYLVAMSDNRLKSLKRRYVVLKNSEMKFYRTQKHLIRDENPTMTIKMRDVKNISKVSSKSGGNGFEVSFFLFFVSSLVI
uniref:PH domain-containing protein n=1 Tax=Panagrolaimus sp. PS1159 TaxID=55785 RepID=A0AC35EXY0_9BILA